MILRSPYDAALDMYDSQKLRLGSKNESVRGQMAQILGPPRARRHPVQEPPAVGRSHFIFFLLHSLHAVRPAEAGVPGVVAAVAAGVMAAEVV
jgi:hypothetical protein